MHPSVLRIFLLALLFSFSGELHAQWPPEKATIEFGTAFSPQWPLTTIRTKRTYIDAETVPSVFPPVLKGVFTFELKDNLFLAGEVAYRGLQNSFVVFDAERDISNYETKTLIDSFLFRMNTAQINVNIRKFRFGSHGRGLYLTAGTGISPVSTKVYPVFTTIYRDEENPDNAFEQRTTTAGSAWSQWTLLGSLRAGFGGHLWLNDHQYIDLGFNTALHFGRGKRAFQNSTYSANPGKVDKATYDFEEGFRDIVRRMSTINSLRQFYTEFSIRYGYIF